MHHFGHVSFRSDIGDEVRELWNRNRMLLEIKQMSPSMRELAHPPGE